MKKQKVVNEAASAMARLRWDKKTQEEKDAYGNMLVEARRNKKLKSTKSK